MMLYEVRAACRPRVARACVHLTQKHVLTRAVPGRGGEHRARSTETPVAAQSSCGVAAHVRVRPSCMLRALLIAVLCSQAAEPLLATAHVHSAPDAHPAPEEDGDLDDQDMTEEERALLQEENHALLQRLQTEMDEVRCGSGAGFRQAWSCGLMQCREMRRALERNLAEVSTLITAMTSRITEQQVSIDRLHDSAVMSSENMKAVSCVCVWCCFARQFGPDGSAQATKHLQQATERLSELRLFIMVFLLGASFILLGLDWYS